jgi:hypothetical protein
MSDQTRLIGAVQLAGGLLVLWAAWQQDVQTGLAAVGVVLLLMAVHHLTVKLTHR